MTARSPRLGARASVVAIALVLCLGLLAPPASATRAEQAQAGPRGASENYVNYVYESLLFRTPDAAGLAYWSNVVASGHLVSFVDALLGSAEWRARWISAFYDEIWLGRPADTAGIRHWSAYLAAGGRWDEFEVKVGSSAESYARGGGTDAGYITHVYRAASGRAPTAAEVTLGEAFLGTNSRSAYVRLILHSKAGLNDRVGLAYSRTLSRDPDPAGQRYWRDYYGRTGKLTRMLAVQITSAEAFSVAQTDGIAAKRGDSLLP